MADLFVICTVLAALVSLLLAILIFSKNHNMSNKPGHRDNRHLALVPSDRSSAMDPLSAIPALPAVNTGFAEIDELFRHLDHQGAVKQIITCPYCLGKEAGCVHCQGRGQVLEIRQAHNLFVITEKLK